MNGIHDLGGMHGFGPIPIERDEPVFHARWEGRVLGIEGELLRRGIFNIDSFRHGIERMAPRHYLAASYYERWFTSITTLLVEKGVITRDELAAPRSGALPAPASTEPQGESIYGTARDRRGFVRTVDAPARYQPGERVRARDVNPAGHTRLPRYVRGRRGTVARVYPAQVFPDTNAHDLGEDPQYLYHVRFDGTELWGAHAEPGFRVGIDLFESYLEPNRQEKT